MRTFRTNFMDLLVVDRITDQWLFGGRCRHWTRSTSLTCRITMRAMGADHLHSLQRGSQAGVAVCYSDTLSKH